MKYGILDAAVPSATDIIFWTWLWVPLLVAVLIVVGLIYIFIRNNRDRKMIEKFEKENEEE